MPGHGLRRILVLALLQATCGSDTGSLDPGTSSTSGGSSDASTTAPGTGSEPTTAPATSGEPTTAATTATTAATTGSDDTGEAVPCGRVLCGTGGICIRIFEGDFTEFKCVPNPDDCVPTLMCSPACQALCDEYSNGICPEQNPDTSHFLECPSFIPCDTFATESTCPEGQKCNPWYCAPLDPDPIPVGEPCLKQPSDPCVDGAYCAFGADKPQGTCRPFCTGSTREPLCPEDSSCVALGDFDAYVCLPTCDPLAPICPGADVCIHANAGPDQFVCVLDASGDGGALFSPCDFANDCDLGLYCSDANMVGTCDPNMESCCLPYCDLDTPVCPDMGLECTPWYAMGQAPPGLEDLGVCYPPP